MSDFEPAIEAQIKGNRIGIARLVFFDFLTQPLRLWEGFGKLLLGGYEWKGAAQLGQISISGTSQGIVEEVTLTIAATAEALARADVDADNLETIGRDLEIWLQFFDPNVTPLGDKFLYFWGKMGPITIERQPADSNGVVAMNISVTAQNILKNFGRPPLGTFSNVDIKQRSSDGADAIGSQMANLVEGSVAWPRF